jgi:UDP-N-acetylmuramoylalanine--D-glutamate ligase
MSIHDLALKGKHNTQNSLASGIASRILEIRKDVVRESLEDFVNVEHRLEFVAKVHGIEFINDSKATNINSTWYALESMQKPVIWVCGGQDKGNDYNEIIDLVSQKVKAIVCLGKNNKKIISAFKDVIDLIVETDNAADAVAAAYKISKKGDAVLLYLLAQVSIFSRTTKTEVCNLKLPFDPFNLSRSFGSDEDFN